MNNTEVLEIINQAVEDLNRDGVEIEDFNTDNLFLTDEEKDNLEQATENLHEEIPANSASLLVDETTSRFSSAIWYERIKSQTVLLAGVGGIGSYIGFLLARLRVANIFLYDPDIVEIANMSGQLYSMSDIGVHKVDALSKMVKDYADYHNVYAISERFTEEHSGTDIMICGFDNMAARKLYFNKWKSHILSTPESYRKECLFIDGRLAAEEFQVLCLKGDDTYNINRYEKEYLFSDREADETICSYKQTTFMANMIASVIINLFVNFIANQNEPLIERDIPFYTNYNAETMFFKTES